MHVSPGILWTCEESQQIHLLWPILKVRNYRLRAVVPMNRIRIRWEFCLVCSIWWWGIQEGIITLLRRWDLFNVTFDKQCWKLRECLASCCSIIDSFSIDEFWNAAAVQSSAENTTQNSSQQIKQLSTFDYHQGKINVACLVSSL